MADGAVGDGHKVLSANKRMGMVGVLAVVACTAIFFNAEEQAAEAKIWDREMAGESTVAQGHAGASFRCCFFSSSGRAD
jgi:hypothetical protein